DGAGIDRVLEVTSTGSLELYDVTVRNGHARPYPFHAGAGGGIRSSGPLTLVRSWVTANHAQHEGGGISAFTMKARDSTVSGNTTDMSGGGIAGIQMDLENVTVSGNQAGTEGGGILLYLYDASLRQVTVTGNAATLGGGIAVDSDDCAGSFCDSFLELVRTVIAGNTAGNTSGSSASADCLALPPHAGSYNLFGVGDECSPLPDDLSGNALQPLDPGLTLLRDQGGPAPTHVPLPGSRLVDFSPACPGTDQRGKPRPADGDLDGSVRCDVGAVEFQPACQPDESTLCLGAGDRFRVTVRWTAQDTSAPGMAVPLASFAGSFWFFDAANLELTVKVLDGCGTNGRFWVFLSGLTDVGVEVLVEDMLTSEYWTHTHAAGTPLQPRLDTNALESCP
ncbi:MAG TPA: choice-of-anchor Q domain-containing protein, partial [Thermoanaerobaculia bacterium]